MATAEQRRDDETEESVLFEWRFTVLMEAGYLPDQARTLALCKEVDVRLAERLLAQGCPRATAVRILL
ncbi:MAG TPA: hypothetical protein VFA42_09080 [Gaiellaceae bacterium]|jgi:hypothetical protein|nr:hypothetical protein [Gaiellaceae bacterium]